MGKFIDLTDQTFGRLTVLSYVGKNKWGNLLCRCECRCPPKTIVTVIGGNLRSGHTKSCGCLQREMAIKANIKHGANRIGKCTKEYRAWCHMKTRCYNSKVECYKNYGGRGIIVCDKWHSFENFLKDMGEAPSLKYTIERTNNNGNYEPDNCEWVTYIKQANNKRNNIMIGNKTLAQVCREKNLPYKTIHKRLKIYNWSINKALNTPVKNMISKSLQQLLKIIKQIYPNQKIVMEYNIAKKGGLFLDVYLPRLSIAFEFDGIQHFKFSKHFYGTKENFLKAQRRDHLKDDLCKEQGIILIRVAYYEDMTKDLVLQKIEKALNV